MNALVIGYGSIGSRHVRILEQLGCRVAVVSARDIPVASRYPDIRSALRSEAPDYVVIAGVTSRHADDLQQVTEAGGARLLLVEKPLFHRPETMTGRPPAHCYVAYNLRFHPLILRLRALLEHAKVVSAQIYVGQYLPLWRPGRDYRQSYSALQREGGGVLRDLSHELDLVNWLFSGWAAMSAIGGRFSSLEITSDDTYALLLKTRRCPVVTIQMNYLDRVGRRAMLINTDDQTIEVDFASGRLAVDGIQEHYQAERDQTYRDMHRAVLFGEGFGACTYAEGLDVVEMIAAAERSSDEGVWIAR